MVQNKKDKDNKGHKEDVIERINQILPRTDCWTALGNEIELILHSDGEFQTYDNGQTTHPVDASANQLPTTKIRQSRWRAL